MIEHDGKIDMLRYNGYTCGIIEKRGFYRMSNEPGKNEKPSEFITVKETCRMLGVSRASVDRYAQAGRLTRYKQGAPARTMFRRKQVLELQEVKQVKTHKADKK